MKIQELTQSNIKNSITAAIQQHGGDTEALIPILLELNEKFGYLSTQVFVELSREMQIPLSRIYSTASFYTMLSVEPHGRHVIQFCESAPCHVMGGQAVYRALVDQLGILPGQTSPDGKWTLVMTSCIGACSVGPVLVIDDQLHGNIRVSLLPEILNSYV